MATNDGFPEWLRQQFEGFALLTVAQRRRLERLFLDKHDPFATDMAHLIESRKRTARRLRWLLGRARDDKGDPYYVSALPDRREFVYMDQEVNL